VSKAEEVIPVTLYETRALRACEAGEASPDQQRLAMSVWMHKFSRAFENPFVPGAHDQTDFRCGRAFVGQKVHEHLRRPMSDLHPDELSKEAKEPKDE